MDRIVCWLTGCSAAKPQEQTRQGTELETFLAQALDLPPDGALIRGVVCGVRVEEVEDPLMRTTRGLDELIDGLARGLEMEETLRSQAGEERGRRRASDLRPALAPRPDLRVDEVGVGDVEEARDAADEVLLEGVLLGVGEGDEPHQLDDPLLLLG